VLIFLDHDQVDDDLSPAVLTFTEADRIRSTLAEAIGYIEAGADHERHGAAHRLAVELTLAYNIVRTAHDRRALDSIRGGYTYGGVS
jgi:hypothetical protein